MGERAEVLVMDEQALVRDCDVVFGDIDAALTEGKERLVGDRVAFGSRSRPYADRLNLYRPLELLQRS